MPPKQKRVNPWRTHPITASALLWLLALATGIATGYGVILFRIGIDTVHGVWAGAGQNIFEQAAHLPWWQIFAGPVIVGTICALVLRWGLLAKDRALGILDVIEADTPHVKSVSARQGLLAALYTTLSLGGGASAGREGPAVHIGATIAAALARPFTLPRGAARILLACGAAAAVAGAFNAPIAGMLFAHELILRRTMSFSVVPTAIASVSATAITRIHLGDYPAFIIPHYEIATYAELPAFALLGVVCAGIAILFIRSLFMAEKLFAKSRAPVWTHPMIAGVFIGIVGVWMPHILGVGYEVTDAALKQQLPLVLLLLLIPAKIIATSVSIAGRFGGGTFSPMLYLGAMAGGAFGLIANASVPAMISGHGLYAIVGMGAVAAAVLGAPISTILIAFELIGDYEVTIALMLAVTVATAITHTALGGGLFHLQRTRKTPKDKQEKK